MGGETTTILPGIAIWISGEAIWLRVRIGIRGETMAIGIVITRETIRTRI